jgi:hypothetical protein
MEGVFKNRIAVVYCTSMLKAMRVWNETQRRVTETRAYFCHGSEALDETDWAGREESGNAMALWRCGAR